MTDAPTDFTRNSIAMNISRDMAILHGIVAPTPEEVEQYNRDYRASWERSQAAWIALDAFREELAAVSDPVARAVLDLHTMIDDDTAECAGCGPEGVEDHDPWPCPTAEAVARQLDIAPPFDWMGHRPGPEPLTMPPEGFKPFRFSPSAFVDAMARKMDATDFTT